MEFVKIIENLEKQISDDNHFIIVGENPVLLSAPHTIKQIRKDGSVKLAEPYTKAIAMYVAKELNCSAIIKNKFTGIDSNSSAMDCYKEAMLNYIKKNNISLVIDIHGASKNRDFDVEFGTLNNLSADITTIKELEEAFKEQGVLNITHNAIFKGGGITKNIYTNTDSDVIQIEINRKYRDINNEENLKKIINALVNFIEQYTSK